MRQQNSSRLGINPAGNGICERPDLLGMLDREELGDGATHRRPDHVGGLDPDVFFRSHRGVIVRVDRIVAIEPTGAGTYQLLLNHPDEPRVPLARERAKHLRERIPFAG